MRLSPAAKVALGVLGGWLAVMPPSAITLALRFREFDPSGLPSTYALTLALGWLTMIVALVGSGYASDAFARHRGTRAPLARMALPAMIVAAVLLALAPSPVWLALSWIVVQVPSAMVITTALADGGDLVSPRRRGLTSGLVGAAPIVALLVGSIAVRILADQLAWAFVLPVLVGALAATPLMFTGRVLSVDDRDLVPRVSAVSFTQRTRRTLWIAFLVGSFLLSWATSTANGFLVTFVQYVVAVPELAIADLSSFAVIVASLLAVTMSVVAGATTAGTVWSVRVWVVAAALCSLALALLLIAPSAAMLLIAAAMFGMAFGAANGVELSVVLLVRRDHLGLGRDFGAFTAVTSVPYVLVPTLASALVAQETRGGLAVMFALAGVCAALATLVVLTLVLRTVTHRPSAAPFTQNSFNKY